MFKLRKLNVVKIVSSKTKKDKLLGMGFVEIQAPSPNKNEESKPDNNVGVNVETDMDYDSMAYQDLKSLAAKRGINTQGMKQKAIIEALKKAGK